MITNNKKEDSFWKKYKDKFKSFLLELWIEFPSFLRENAIIISLLLLYIPFHRYWETHIKDHIIDNFISTFEPNLLCDSLFICITIISFLFIVKNWEKNITRRTKVLCLIALVFWAYYSCYNVKLGLENYKYSSYYLEFKHLKTINALRYVDIIPIIVICTLFPMICSYLKKAWELIKGGWNYIIIVWNYIFKLNKSERIKETNGEERITNGLIGLVPDTPIFSIDDVLGRKEIAYSAMDSLIDIETTKGCFTFGICAPWGSGKSSFLNMMKDRISSINKDVSNRELKNKYKRIITIDFNPWLYSVKIDLVTAFFDELSKSLERYDQTLSKSFIDYSKLISSFKTAETEFIASIIDLVQQDSTIQDKKRQIVKILKRINRKIIVFIDDLDRLDDDEILEMMKLLRNVSDFPNMYFVAAYDKEYLTSCLSKKIPRKTTEYIEKIFQIEFPLLESTHNELRNKLLLFLKELTIMEEEQKKCLDQFIRWTDGLAFKHIITNFRDVIRFTNVFLFSYKNLKDFVNIRDLLLIELIKMKYPAVFNYFAKHREFILVTAEQTDPYKFWRLLEPNDLSNKIGFFHYDGLYHSFMDALQERKNELAINDDDIPFIKEIFDILFPIKQNKSHAYSIQRGISDKKYTDNYFVHNSSQSDISDNDLKTVIQDDDLSYIKDMFIRWSSKNSLGTKLIKFEPSKKEELIKIIEVLLYIKSFNKDNVSNDLITTRIRELCIFNTPKNYTNEDKVFIKEALTQYGYNKGICYYLYSLYYEKERWDYPLDIEEVNDVRIKIFKNCLETPGISGSDVIGCFVHLLNTEVENGKFIDKPIPDISRLLEDYIEKNIRDFITILIIDRMIFYNDKEKAKEELANGRYTLHSNLINNLWNRNDFYQFVDKLDESSDKYIAEFKRFVEKYKNANSGDTEEIPINFDFHYIDK